MYFQLTALFLCFPTKHIQSELTGFFKSHVTQSSHTPGSPVSCSHVLYVSGVTFNTL